MELWKILLLVFLCVFVGFIVGMYVYDRIIMKKKLDKAIEVFTLYLSSSLSP